MEKKYLLGFDCGTNESKGVLITAEGELMKMARRPHQLISPQPGYAEHDPIKTWWKDFCEIVKELFETTGVSPEAVAGIGISTVMAGITPVDRSGNPLRNAILYGIDQRCTKQAAELNEAVGEAGMQEWAGQNMDIEVFGPKILWIRENEPEIFQRTFKFTIASGFLTARLTGRYCVDRYSAMAAQPMLNRRTMRWDEEMCRLVCPKEMLPDIMQTTDVIGGVTAKAAAETGLAEGTPVICGTTDAGAEAVSVGVVRPEEMMVMYGSTTFFIYTTETYRDHTGMWAGDYTIPGLYCNSGGMATTGSLTKWLRDVTAKELLQEELAGGENAYATLFREAETVPLGSHGVMILPYFMGERMPIRDPLASGLILGLDLNKTRGDLVRAAFEGIGYGICQNLDLLRAQGADMSNLVAVGGGTKTRQWMQIVSDICGVKQSIPEISFGASYGDALLAGLGVGLISSPEEIKRMIRIRYTVVPDPEKTAMYQPYRELFKKAYKNNRELMHQLKQIEGGKR